ncbi:hypothetical protein ACU8V6_00460 [Vibrio alginolyticus]
MFVTSGEIRYPNARREVPQGEFVHAALVVRGTLQTRGLMPALEDLEHGVTAAGAQAIGVALTPMTGVRVSTEP